MSYASASKDIQIRKTSNKSTAGKTPRHAAAKKPKSPALSDDMAVSFNSKTLQYSHFSNFFPFVKHNTLKGSDGRLVNAITVKLTIPSAVSGASHVNTNTEVSCNSLEAAYMLGKYLSHVDPKYGSEVILPRVTTATAQEMKSMGSKGKYVLWKASTSGISKAAAGRFYDEKQPAFRASNFKLMATLLWSKYTLNDALKRALINTYPRALHEVGRPSVWTSSGSDGLGKLLGRIRGHLLAGTTNVEDVLADLPNIVHTDEDDKDEEEE